MLASSAQAAISVPWISGQSAQCSISGFTAADSVAVDPVHGKLYVTDRDRNRVLRFAYPLTNDLTVSSAEAVLGQADMAGAAANRGGSPAANTLNLPYGLVVFTNGDLWISDYSNHRVLKYANAWNAANGATASVVLGQSSFTGSSSGTSATALNHPCGLSLDSSGNLWLADMGNNRVLRFNAASSKASGAAADGVLGQGDFAGNLSNRSGSVAANTLSSPYGLGAAGTTLWVADFSNSRVLRFDSAASKANGAAADGVIGQPSFTVNSANRGGSIAANSLYYPSGAAGNSAGDLYISDAFNYRVLVFTNAVSKANGAAADYCVGASSFTVGGNLGTPWHLVYDDTLHRLLIGRTSSGFSQYFNAFLTTTALGGSPNPDTVLGSTVTLTATVTTASNGPAPSAFVSFLDGPNSLGSAQVDASGRAVFMTTALTDGNHSLTAVLTNTTMHVGSQSAPYTQIMGKFTCQFSLTASPTISPEGAPVVFEATLTPPTNNPSLTGSMIFSINGTVAATVALRNNAARWTNNTLVMGTSTIQAVYSGDANFRSLTNSLNHQVIPKGALLYEPIANIEQDDSGTNAQFYTGADYGSLYAGSFSGTPNVSAFKFDLSGLSGKITRATLRIRVADKDMGTGITNFNLMLYGSQDNSWSDVPPLRAPASVLVPAIATNSTAALKAMDWITNDVTGFVTARFASADKLASFEFQTDPTTSYYFIALYPKEADGTNRPVLEVQTASTETTLTLSTNAGFYTVSLPAVAMDTNALVTDGAGLLGSNATLTVAIVTNATSSDLLAVQSQGAGAGQISVSGSSVFCGSLSLATLSGGSGPSPLLFTLTTNATETNVTTLLRQVVFSTTSTNTNLRAFTVSLLSGTNRVTAGRSMTLNRQPVAGPTLFSATAGQVLTIPCSNVLSNGYDVDNDPLSITLTNLASAHGGSLANTNSVLVYTPPAGSLTQDSFTYVLNDGRGGQAAGTVTLQFLQKNHILLNLSTNGPFVTLAGVPSASYAIEASTNFVNWTRLTTNTASGTGLLQFMDSGAKTMPKRFYRAVSR